MRVDEEKNDAHLTVAVLRFPLCLTRATEFVNRNKLSLAGGGLQSHLVGDLNVDNLERSQSYVVKCPFAPASDSRSQPMDASAHGASC